jgi:hypothetical protein
MRTREELLELIKSDRINESELNSTELDLITGDDFESFKKFLDFRHSNKEFFIARADYCERNMKRDLDL